MKVSEYAASRSVDLVEVKRLLKDVRDVVAEPHSLSNLTDSEAATLDSLFSVKPASGGQEQVAAAKEAAISATAAAEQMIQKQAEQMIQKQAEQMIQKQAEQMIQKQAESLQKMRLDSSDDADVQAKAEALAKKERDLAKREQALTEAIQRLPPGKLQGGKVFTHEDLIAHVRAAGEDPSKVDLCRWLKDHKLPSPQKKFRVTGLGDSKMKVVTPQEVFAVDESAAINEVARFQGLEAYRYRFKAAVVAV